MGTFTNKFRASPTVVFLFFFWENHMWIVETLLKTPPMMTSSSYFLPRTGETRKVDKAQDYLGW